MYPMAVIFSVAIAKKFDNVYFYTIPISIIGAVITSYHYNSDDWLLCFLLGNSCSAMHCKIFSSLRLYNNTLNGFDYLSFNNGKFICAGDKKL